MGIGDTYFGVKMDFDSLDEKLQRFVLLRNELAGLAEEIGFEVSRGLLVLEKKSAEELEIVFGGGALANA